MSLTTPLTELEAINEMLSIIGEAPINSLSGTVTTDVTLAQNILNKVCREMQTQGWHFNTEKDYELTPDINNQINLAINIVRVDADGHPDIDVVQRGQRLYDRKNRTYQFSSKIKAEVILLLPFEEMPEVARQYCMVRAGRLFQDRSLGAEDLHIYTEEDEKKAMADLKEAEGDTGDHTIFNNIDTAKILDRDI